MQARDERAFCETEQSRASACEVKQESALVTTVWVLSCQPHDIPALLAARLLIISR
jgi:hypothetical protein